MSGGLERRSPSGKGVSVGRGPAPTGQASDISQFQFTKRALTYDTDMPRQFRQGVRQSTELALRSGRDAHSAGELIVASDTTKVIGPVPEGDTRRVERAVIASGMRQLDKPRRTKGRVVQRRIGWQATPDRIVITTAERELARTSEGKYSPAGSWLIEDRRTYRETSGAASKRVGTVPGDGDTAGPGSAPSAPESRNASGAEAAVVQAFPHGADALGLLPGSVRASAIGRVPAPIQFDGVILESPGPDGAPGDLEVDVVRMDARRAVVLQATRAAKASAWEVSQATYQLADVVVEQA